MTDWRAPAFLAAAHAWIRSHVTVTGEIEHTHVQWWSTVFRVPTSDGSVWFKATVDGATFEPPLTLLLAQLRPEVVPELIAPPRLCSRRSAPTTSTASLWPAAVPRVRTDRRPALGGRAPRVPWSARAAASLPGILSAIVEQRFHPPERVL